MDLKQFTEQILIPNITEITSSELEKYIAGLHRQYKPKTARRKIASLKALFYYLEYKEIIEQNPFNKIRIRFREPVILPKTIPLHTVELFLSAIYKQYQTACTAYQKRNAASRLEMTRLLLF